MIFPNPQFYWYANTTSPVTVKVISVLVAMEIAYIEMMVNQIIRYEYQRYVSLPKEDTDARRIRRQEIRRLAKDLREVLRTGILDAEKGLHWVQSPDEILFRPGQAYKAIESLHASCYTSASRELPQ